MTRPETPKGLIAWTVGLVVLTAIGLWLLYALRAVVLLVYISALLAIGFSPLVRFLQRRPLFGAGPIRIPRWLGILAVYVSALGVVIGLGVVVVPPFAEQAQEFSSGFPELFRRSQQFLVQRGLLREAVSLQEAIGAAPFDGGAAVGTVLGAFWGLVGGLVGVATVLILTFYFALEAETILCTFVRLFPREGRARVASMLPEITRKVSAWLGGQLLLGAIIGSTTAIALWLLGLPYFFVLAVIAGVGEMVPVIGPFLAALPAIAVALGISVKTTLFVAAFFLVQQQLENNILVPKLMERQLGLNAVTVVMALLAGTALLGIVGALLAVPTAAIAQVLVQELGILRDADGGSGAAPRSDEA